MGGVAPEGAARGRPRAMAAVGPGWGDLMRLEPTLDVAHDLLAFRLANEVVIQTAVEEKRLVCGVRASHELRAPTRIRRAVGRPMEREQRHVDLLDVRPDLLERLEQRACR